jgi:hypothetical protein
MNGWSSAQWLIWGTAMGAAMGFVASVAMLLIRWLESRV